MSSSTPPPASSEPESSAGSALVDTTAVVEDLSFKQQVGDAANRWLARNRSLVLRQTPVWAQSLAALMIGLGGIALVGGIFFRIDEVVTVQGQLRSIGGTVDVKTPAGGRVSEVMFKDGETVEKGQELLRFDTRQAANQKATLTRMILLEEDQLKAQLNTLESQKNTLNGRQEVLVKRIGTKSLILTEMKVLVEQGGFQRLQFLEQQDQLFELEKQLTQIKEEKIGSSCVLSSFVLKVVSQLIKCAINCSRLICSSNIKMLRHQFLELFLIHRLLKKAYLVLVNVFFRSFPKRVYTLKFLCQTKTLDLLSLVSPQRFVWMHSLLLATEN